MDVTALWRSRSGRLGLVLCSVTVVAAAIAGFWTPHDPRRIDPSMKWLGWSLEHPFGTDGSGKDIASQLLAGSRTSIAVATASVAIAAGVGIALGLASASLPRSVGEALAHVVDILLALPGIILALVLVAALEASLLTVSLAIGVSAGVALARVVKTEAAAVMSRDYVLAARGHGASGLRIARAHVVPNIAPTVIVQLSVIAAYAVLSEASLSYLGLTSATTPSWGRLLQSLQTTVTIHPGAMVVPGVVIVAATLGFNLLGDGFRDALDPRRATRSATVGDGHHQSVDIDDHENVDIDDESRSR